MMAGSPPEENATTVEDMIGWASELLWLQGEVGLLKEWGPEHLSNLFVFQAERPQRERDLVTADLDLMGVLGLAVADDARERWLDRRLKQHGALHKELPAALDGRARSRGIMDERFRSLSVKGKLMAIMGADLPRTPDLPKFRVFLIVVMATGPGTTRKTIDLHLPWSLSFIAFQAILRDQTARPARLCGRDGGYTLHDGPWQYQLVDRASQPVGMCPVNMTSERDFRDMVRQLRSKDRPCALVWHVRRARARVEHAALIVSREQFGSCWLSFRSTMLHHTA